MTEVNVKIRPKNIKIKECEYQDKEKATCTKCSICVVNQVRTIISIALAVTLAVVEPPRALSLTPSG
jgi:hypothetical protein